MSDKTKNFLIQQIDSSECLKFNNIIQRINLKVIKKILKDSLAPSMKALRCIIENLIDSGTKFITHFTQLQGGQYGAIYRAVIFKKIKVILKEARFDNNFQKMMTMREYIIGLKCINKLRYILPTFLYTFSCFNKTKDFEKISKVNDSLNQTTLILEQIEGYELKYLMETKNIDFNRWLIIFCELLISLEVGQEEFFFSHYDLHPANLIVNLEKSSNYSVNIHNKTYNVTTPHKISIIDFGLSSVLLDDTVIGSSQYEHYGIMNYMIPGYDIFHFLRNSTFYFLEYLNSKENIQNLEKIYELYKNVININFEDSNTDIWTKLRNFNISLSPGAVITPQIMLNYLIDLFPTILEGKIQKINRRTYKIINYSSFTKDYYDICDNEQKGVVESLKNINKCFDQKGSGGYVTMTYLIQVLVNYNKKLGNVELEKQISFYKRKLELNKVLIEVDYFWLEQVFKIAIPTQQELDFAISNILSIQIDNKNPALKLTNIGKLNHTTSWVKKYVPYLEYYYTILELNLQEEFTEWINKLHTSEIWFFYERNIFSVQQSFKWRYSLKNSIKI